ncbi:MAG TPA: TIGR03067 domain-containing protein [Gemmatales bacterium]|nr:TIGR03067 domain-containing protein [Gemmatales bacterium]
MKASFVLLLTPLLMWCSFNVLAEDDAVAKEDKKFEGTWKVVGMEVGGKKWPEEEFVDMTFIFKGKLYEQKIGDMLVEAGKQELNPAKKPMHMDITVTEGETKGKKQLTIYEWTSDELVKICAADHDDPKRPEKFETTPGGRDMIFILQRKK